MTNNNDLHEARYHYGKLLLTWMDMITSVKMYIITHCIALNKISDLPEMKWDKLVIREFVRQHKARYGDKYSGQLSKLQNALIAALGARNDLAHGVGDQLMILSSMKIRLPSFPPDVKKLLHAQYQGYTGDSERILQVMADYTADNPPAHESAMSEVLRLIKKYEPPILAVEPLMRDYNEWLNKVAAEQNSAAE